MIIRLRVIGPVALILLFLGVPGARAQNAIEVDRARSEPRFAIAVAMSPVTVVPAAGAATVTPPQGRLLRIHFAVEGTVPVGWTIEVRSNGNAWWSPALDADTGDLWSDQIGRSGQPPASATVQLIGPAGTTPPRVVVDRVSVPQDHATPQAITPPSDQSRSIADASNRIKGWGRSVARLQFVGDDGGGYFCTAFLVSPSLMLTNNHCIGNHAEMKSAVAEFDYDVAEPSERRRFKELVLHDQGLDYALLRLAQPSTRAPLTLAPLPLTEHQGLVIVEHPRGARKRFSRVDCHVRGPELPGLGPAKTDFGHYCDTEGGSSGSPIQDFSSGKVIGLHHLGFEPGQPNPVNRGVKIGLVLDDIQQRKPAVRTEIVTP